MVLLTAVVPIEMTSSSARWRAVTKMVLRFAEAPFDNAPP